STQISPENCLFGVDRSAGERETECGCLKAENTESLTAACLSGRSADEDGFTGTGSSANRLAFFRHLERVETLRCYWELKHVELKSKDGVEKPKVCLKVLKSQKKKKPPDVADAAQTDLEEVQKLNQQNAELSHGTAETAACAAEHLDFIKDEQEPEEKKREELQAVEQKEEAEKDEQREISNEQDKQETERPEDLCVPDVPRCESSAVYQESSEEHCELTGSTKRRVTEENLEKDDLKKSRVEQRSEEVEGSEEQKSEDDAAKEGTKEPEEPEGEKKEGETIAEEYIIDCSPPPPAPFEHRVVTSKTQQITAYYTINREEVLGGGRFGMVHKCVEKSSGLTLAAKIIKARSQKEKEVVKSEIEVMNQLNHANLIQLYAAYESRYDVTLVMEYVEGGELFDRIIDENYKLTELDTVLFIRQITEGLQYMHKMYILHLDLKPENILCVSRETNKVKIIDFGLARRYKPREKLRVNFGTPEFLAPEVINYEFVSFPTDMWSLGVITYMLLSGLSPFLGDDDNETLNNILECKWGFEEAEFEDISEEAKDFIKRLLVQSKGWRMSASQSLKHPWLSDRSLHYRLHQKVGTVFPINAVVVCSKIFRQC
uniref:Myosin light chain kinase family, member 4b n=1 Tax=Astyanax mexicanus TaxID=7994 RepID=A0A8B9J7E2_ASTMX